VTANGDKGRNESVAFDPSGREIARYCKMHPFSPGGELDNYERGPALRSMSGRDALYRHSSATTSVFRKRFERPSSRRAALHGYCKLARRAD